MYPSSTEAAIIFKADDSIETATFTLTQQEDESRDAFHARIHAFLDERGEAPRTPTQQHQEELESLRLMILETKLEVKTIKVATSDTLKQLEKKLEERLLGAKEFQDRGTSAMAKVEESVASTKAICVKLMAREETLAKQSKQITVLLSALLIGSDVLSCTLLTLTTRWSNLESPL